MEMMQLEMFMRVAEEGSVLKAARAVHRTQPAVSIALRKLTGEIGAPLFLRAHKKDFRLSPAGEVLYEYATRIIGLRDEARATLLQEENGCSSRFSVGVCGEAALQRFPRLAKTFQRQFPKVQLEMKSGAPENLLCELFDRKIALLLLSQPLEDHPAASSLTATLLPASVGQTDVWIVRSRRGQSHLAAKFEDAAALLPKSKPARRWPLRGNLRSFLEEKTLTRQAML